jgi:ubiquinone/menaquinone biosynthesis C-methylase UbiE
MRERSAATTYRDKRRAHWDEIATKVKGARSLGGYYHRWLQKVYSYLIPPDASVLEIGCGKGNLLAAVKPRIGVGVDFSSEMLKAAARAHPQLNFVQADGHELPLAGEFDFVIFSDVLNDAWDVQRLFEQIGRAVKPRTRLIVNTYSRLWQLPLELARRMNLATPLLPQNWLTVEDIENLMRLEKFEAIRKFSEIVLPLPLGPVAMLLNRYLAKLAPFKLFALTNFVIARPVVSSKLMTVPRSVSVIIPARNEAGNIPHIFEKTPEMGAGTELIFVEGHSTDNTYEVIKSEIEAHPERNSRLYRQEGIGKGDAVRLGFSKAQGEILMILDADLSVPPKDLSRFYNALVSGRGEFINGVRLVYPMEEKAMRYLNLLGNKFFSLAFTWLLGQPIKDTLCGTKAIAKSDYDLIASRRDYFGEFDPFGDFDLLFGAAFHNLKIVEIPIRYRQRIYGETNIDRWRHGWLLLKMTLFAARKIKFV